jgi:DNA/RNA-binding domain of Phe-tRNA-synthetase-like protein
VVAARRRRPARADDAGLRQRLRAMSDRYTGAKAIQLRTDPIPHAYRAFYRHIGLDPDEDRVPIEAVVLERLKHGGFQAHDRVTDAATIALVETGVPIWVLDEARVDPPLGIDQRDDDLVVADGRGDVCALFAHPGPDRAPGEETVAMRLFTVQVAGVPAIHVEEALFTAHEALAE